MRRKAVLPADLRLRDLLVFFAARRCASVTGAARALDASPSYVSKALARLEAQLDVALFSRSAHGIVLTDSARRILPDLEKAMEHLGRAVARERSDGTRTLGFAAPSYLVQLFLPTVAAALPSVRLCGVQLAPAMLRARAADNVFDVALLVGQPRLPSGWHLTRLGELRRALFARPSLAQDLGAPPLSLERLRRVPFIAPLQQVDGRVERADDDCPLAPHERRRGHEVESVALALDLAVEVDQLVFGPAIAAHRHVAAGALVELPVAGWRCVEALTLACSGERVLASEHAAIVDAVARRLHALGRTLAHAEGDATDRA